MAYAQKQLDLETAQGARNLLQCMVSLPSDAITVLVDDGWVTLSGKLHWHYQRLAALSAVRDLINGRNVKVRGVSDLIEVCPHNIIKESILVEVAQRVRRQLRLNLGSAVTVAA